MKPATLLIFVNSLLLHPVDLGCGRLIGLSWPVQNDRHLNLVVVDALALDSIAYCLLFTIEDNTEGLNGPSRSLLDGGMAAGEDSGPVGAGQCYSLTLQVGKFLLIRAIVKLALEGQAVGERVYVKQTVEHVEGRRLISSSQQLLLR